MEKRGGIEVYWVHGFTVYDSVWCILRHGNVLYSSNKLNDQPVRERVTANYYIKVTPVNKQSKWLSVFGNQKSLFVRQIRAAHRDICMEYTLSRSVYGKYTPNRNRGRRPRFV